MTKVELSIGQTYGHWTVISLIVTRRGATGAMCRCVCGLEKHVYKSHLVHEYSRSCGCMRPVGNTHAQFTGVGDLKGNHWNQIVRNAKGQKDRASLEMNITIQEAWDLFEAQERKCALSGIPIVLGGMREKTASLDRIDPMRGYVHDNIQWVHKTINRMKNVFSQEDFLHFCRAVAVTHPLKTGP